MKRYFFSSLKYRLLSFVILQAASLVAMLFIAWAINPNWVLAPSNSVAVQPHALKNHYGLLTTLHADFIGSFSNDNDRLRIEAASHKLLSEIQSLQKSVRSYQEKNITDLSTLAAFLIHYKSLIHVSQEKVPASQEHIIETSQLFSRVQSELFYILEELESHNRKALQATLQASQTSLMVWLLMVAITLSFSVLFSLRYSRHWQKQYTEILHSLYRYNANKEAFEIDHQHLDDELKQLATSLESSLNKSAS